MHKGTKYSQLVLRTGLAIVLLWFGFSQLKNAAGWTRMVPDYAQALADPTTLVYINGTLEIALATLLLLGLFTRVTSFITSLHLLHITTIVGYGATGARDLAIALAAIALFLQGPDEMSVDALRKKKSKANL